MSPLRSLARGASIYANICINICTYNSMYREPGLTMLGTNEGLMKCDWGPEEGVIKSTLWSLTPNFGPLALTGRCYSFPVSAEKRLRLRKKSLIYPKPHSQ